jgi:hypothetical protein
MPRRSGTAELDALALTLTRAQLAVSRRAAAQKEAVRALAMQERRYRALAEVGTLVAGEQTARAEWLKHRAGRADRPRHGDSSRRGLARRDSPG